MNVAVVHRHLSWLERGRAFAKKLRGVRHSGVAAEVPSKALYGTQVFYALYHNAILDFRLGFAG